MRYLKTNTAVIVTVGPFLDKTDGVTLETGLTITNERITLTADTYAGSAPTIILDNVTGATSGTANDLNYITGQDNGMMQIELAAADVNRLGFMRLTITDAANHVPVWEDFMVLPANVFDSLVLGSGTDYLDVSVVQLNGSTVDQTSGLINANVKQISTDATAADNAEAFFDGTGYAGTNNVIPTVTTTGTATNLTNLPAAAATAAELAKVPKSDSTVSWNATALAAINAEVDTALNTAIPGSPTANSINERVAAIDDLTQASGGGDLAAVKTDVAAAHVHAAGAETQATAAATSLANGGFTDLLIDGIKTKTDYLPSATAGSAGGVFIAGSNAATSVTTALTANITGNLSGSVGSVTGAVGSVTGAVGSVTGSVGSVTGAVGSVTGAVGSVTGAVGSVAANGITATSIAADAINATAIKADAVTKIQSGLATPTNITAGVITTVTNLTNAPTNGDLTATMKTSVTTAATAATPTAAAVTGAVGSVTGAVGSVTGAVGSVAANGITATSIAADAINAAAIKADAVTKIQENLATAAQVSGIGSGTGAALNFAVDADNTGAPLNGVTFVGSATGTYANTLANDASVHAIASAANAFDLVYGFTVGAGRAATKVVLRAAMAAVGDTVTIQAYNFLTPAWETRTTFTGTASQLVDIPLLAGHTGIGANSGKVYVRFVFSEADAGTININEVYCQAQNLGQTIGYQDGAIYVNADKSNVGTTPFVDGTRDNAVQTIAAAYSIATATGLTGIDVAPGTTLTLTQSAAKWTFQGGGRLALNGQSIADTTFKNIYTVSGTSAGDDAKFMDCGMGDCTLLHSYLIQCRMKGTLTLTAANVYYLVNCSDTNESANTQEIVFAAGAKVYLRNWSGALTLKGMAAGDELIVDGAGRIVIDASCSGGTIVARGFFGEITGKAAFVSAGGSLTETARYSVEQVNAEADKALADYDPPTNTEMEARTLVAAGYATAAALTTVDGIVDAIVADTNELQTDWANGGRLDLILDAAGSAGDPWVTELPGAYTSGKAGYILGTNLAAVYGATEKAAIDLLDDANGLVNIHDTLDTVAGYLDTEVAAILADTNELQTDWANGGRLDLILDAAGSAGDPWVTALPGSYGAGSAGKIVGDNLNATVGSRLATTGYTTPLDAAGVRTAVGLASANLDTQIAALPTDADVTAAATAATPTAAAVTGSVGSVTGAVGSVTGSVGSVTGAVGSVTGNVGGNVTGSVGSVTGAVGSVAANGITATSIAADALNAAAIKADAVTKIQSGLATPTNITAGVITTVTNLTNAPTAGDLTATMKASVTTAVPTVATIRAEIDTNSTQLAAILEDSGTTLPSTLATIAGYVDTEVAAIKAKTDNLPAAPAAVGSAMTLTSAYDAAKSAASQTSVDDIPTNSELTTALAGADDATLAAIAALNNLSSAQAQTAAAAALTAYDPPTNAEMEARTLVAANYFDPAADTVARVTLVDTTTTNTDMRGTNSALLAANYIAPDNAGIADIPTNAELATALAGADDATLAAIAALNNLSSAQAQTAAAAALTAYDPPTNTEMEARTLVAANYATAAALTAVDAVTDKLDTALVLDGAVYQLTANALELAPIAAPTADPLLNTVPGAYTAGTAGYVLGNLTGIVTGSGTYTDIITDGTNPVDGVRVQLSTDAAGTNRVYEAYTDAQGVFVMYPDPGTYYRWLDLAWYSFPQGVQVVVT